VWNHFSLRLCQIVGLIKADLRRPFLLLLTVSFVVCGLLEATDVAMSSQKVFDIHTDPDPGAGTETEGQIGGKEQRFKYTTLTGYFLQDDPSTDPYGFDFTKTNFGLIDRTYESDSSLPNNGRDLTGWERFEHHVSELNKNANRVRHESGTATQVEYKLLFLGRHGNGFHNVAERYYGAVAWDCYFSTLDSDKDKIMTWADAHLTKEGVRQAKEANTFWKDQIKDERISLPQSYYVSPLDRALETANVTFGDLQPSGNSFRPTVMERAREGAGIHTCDRRSSVTYIKSRFPKFITDEDPLLTETDTFWDPIYRETNEALAIRQAKLLDSIVAKDQNERISITAHSGAISMLLHAIGHRKFVLGTGAVIPVLIKAEPVSQRATRRHEDDHDDVGAGTHIEYEIEDRDKWQTIPKCPADLDLEAIGFQRWKMGLKEFLAGVENGTLQIEEVAFKGRH
jgi:broad specificity phosphatase PhoE